VKCRTCPRFEECCANGIELCKEKQNEKYERYGQRNY